VKDIHDVITQAKFGDNRLRGLGVVAGQISAFPIDFAGRPYNTLTLPCERVITQELECSGAKLAKIVGTRGRIQIACVGGVQHEEKVPLPSTKGVSLQPLK